MCVRERDEDGEEKRDGTRGVVSRAVLGGQREGEMRLSVCA